MISSELKSLLLENSFQKNIKKGDPLYLEGNPSRYLYFIESGEMKVSKSTSDGQEFVFEIAKENSVLGELTLFSGDSIHTNSAKALSDCTVYVINRKEIEKRLLSYPLLCSEYIRFMGEQLQKTQSKFRDLLLFGKTGALFSTLIRLSNTYGIKKESGIFIDLKLSNKTLSEFCGTTREGVNRILGSLKDEKVISVEKGFIIIHDLSYLKQAIRCENCPSHVCQI